ncbi:hypothetical protein IB238_14500 [Rhizobium sp. ARZ01]|uniref:hypothetical protein n=1 Tax=Rhizobium sp. ARZ01 TaxID=2769313 RepID=UPI00177A9B7A|nr:hypothetical protein [Rhizobium sp. ARZ01]MBD9373835.1 hypothetical protein [Rhizobium sp. ARZ01]
MIKLVLTGIWICAITLASVYFSMQMAAAPRVDEEAAARAAALELVKGSQATIPVISDGAVKGYFLARLSYTANKELAAKQAVPMGEAITDELYTLLVGQRMIDVEKLDSFDVDTFRATIKDGLNKRFGEAVIDQVIIEQIDYIAKVEVKTKPARKGTNIVKNDAAAATATQSPTN